MPPVRSGCRCSRRRRGYARDTPIELQRYLSHRRTTGQALVEFSLVVPILLVLVIGLADLGRVFAAGIVAESATRNAAEIVAQQYLQDYPLGPPSPVPAGYYAKLHLRAAQAVCAEMKSLPNTNFIMGSGGPACSGMPIVLVCVRDGKDDACGTEPFGDPIPPSCDSLTSAPSNTLPGGTENSRFVEVRVCYRFTPITRSLLLPIPEIYLQRIRMFTVADY